MLALGDNKPGGDADGLSGPKSTTALAPMPVPKPVDNLALAVVNKGALAIPGSGGGTDGPTSAEFDATAPGIGYAFIEFANIEGSSKAKKALHGRKFGPNLVEAEYFSETKYLSKDFVKPLPNTEESKQTTGYEL